MSEQVVSESGVARRNLIRGGAIAVGAAGAAVALNAAQARAANGDPVLAGQSVNATSATQVSMNSATESVLALHNNQGAALNLEPTTANPLALHPGDLISRSLGPDVVIDQGNGPELTFVATGLDLPPATVAFTPVRVMDTRSATLRDRVVDSSTKTWFDSSKRVKAGAWIDVAIADASEVDLTGAYLNATAVSAASRGFLTVYPSGESLPNSSNLNFPASTSIANLCFVAPGLVDDLWCVRVRVNVAVHVILDFSGAVGYFAPPAAGVAANPGASAKARLTARRQRGDAVRGRITRSLKLPN
ncbi:MAG: hypothetical protein QM711_15795 [Micropruina sp.]|uniref:hypothetical protein n=1 Tax=Micropruina sp. TaxID=2737536 RepID=UPI0039E4798E